MTRASSALRKSSARTGRLALLPAGLALLMLLTEGCGPSPQAGPGPRRTVTTRPSNASPITNTDSCANRLHDFCGPLLLYFNLERRLPQRIEELGQVPGFDNLRDFTCPVSRQPYIYSPTGIPGLEPGSRVVLYDPMPSHSGMRWGIAVQVPGEDQPLIAKVIALPESKIPRQPAGR